MKRRTLLAIIIVVLIAVVIYGAFTWDANSNGPNSETAKKLKELLPLFVGLLAACLTAAFQRRVSYLQALREFWKQTIPAFQALIVVIRDPTASHLDYLRARAGWCGVIDSVRGVFRNVNGLFPYEPIKAILPVFEALDPTKPNPSLDRNKVEADVCWLWKLAHDRILHEFDSDRPALTVTKPELQQHIQERNANANRPMA